MKVNAARRGMMVLLMSTAMVVVAAETRAQSALAQQYEFSIAAKPIRQGLNDIGRVTGLSVVFTETAAASGTGQAVSGVQTVQQALARLLSGTGLAYRFTNANTVTIYDPASFSGLSGAAGAGVTVLSPVALEGGNPNSTLGTPAAYAGGQVATGGQLGMLGNVEALNTPFSQTSYTAQTITDRQAETVQDVLSNDPSIIASSQTGTSTDVQFTRGFQEYGRDGSRSLNGLAGMAPMLYPSTDMLERVDVLRGPSALANGMSLAGSGAIGGTVNLATKMATDAPITQLTTRYTSRTQLGAHLDFGRRFGENNQFGLRFNGAFGGGKTALPTQETRFGSAALSLDYRGERLRVALDLAYQDRNLNPTTNTLMVSASSSTITQVPDVPSRGAMLSPAWAKENRGATLGMLRGEFDISENVTAYAAVGAQTYRQIIEGVSMPVLPAVFTGAYRLSPAFERTHRDVLSMQAGLRGTAVTGGISHAFSLNVSQANWRNRTSSWTGTAMMIPSLQNPVFGPAVPLTDPGPPVKTSERKLFSIGAANTMSMFEDRVQLTLGLRYQKVDITNFSSSTGAVTSSYSSNAVTPALGLVLKPRENVSVYLNYAEGLQPGTTVGTAYANAGEIFPPYVNRQYEAGVKVDWGRITTTLAMFQISQPSTMSVPDPLGGLPTLALDGQQRNRGIELNAFGELSDTVRLLGGVTFLDSRQMKTQGGLRDGQRGYGAPRVRLVLGAEADIRAIPGLSVNGRFTYTDRQVIANARPDLTIPSWTQLDLGLRYTFATRWTDAPATVQLNIDNVLNGNFWKGSYANGAIYRSDPRTVRLSTTFRF